MSTLTIHFFDRQAIAAVWTGLFGQPPSFWECPCGCRCAFAYGRAGTVVWIQPCFAVDTGTEEPSAPLFGIQREDQLERLIAAAPYGAMRSLAAIVRPLVPGARGADA